MGLSASETDGNAATPQSIDAAVRALRRMSVVFVAILGSLLVS
ncbi:hypothetical protein SCE1572_11935 [Sorangium cellulosum So0157-2]|uniref:Uncharacterized protein n=1 Tax=Sorangium cellulosum So0157-2 TaxID=1254432 RepID=S4XS03_SORCE|nr:hypothetical protein SCE1572_11935 [Sorangium cellulosum So0157-2]